MPPFVVDGVAIYGYVHPKAILHRVPLQGHGAAVVTGGGAVTATGTRTSGGVAAVSGTGTATGSQDVLEIEILPVFVVPPRIRASAATKAMRAATFVDGARRRAYP